MGGLRSPTGRNPGRLLDFRQPCGEVRLLPTKGEPYQSYVMADYAGMEARMMASLLLVCCKVCGDMISQGCLAQHCRDKKDPVHLALEVMET